MGRDTGAGRHRVDTEKPTAELLRIAYRRGIFPMADSSCGRVQWFSPDPRAILPLERFHVPHSVGRVVRAGRFRITTDTAFPGVIQACAERRPERQETWLSEGLIDAYVDLHWSGDAHSLEAWIDERLVGGLYGVHLGAAFFGESMFSRPEHGGRDASKVCLVHLVETLRAHGFRLLDTQFSTPHLARFGCVEIPRARYLDRLRRSLASRATWPPPGDVPPGAPPAADPS